MDLKTFHLKYRPQNFAELDIQEIGQALLQRVKNDKIPHALLFSGPKGIGKTSAARIFAKAINCASKTGEPCNKCDTCRGITNGSLLDLMEIDAASNRGIDDIRDLREKIKLSPVKAKYKVYIIDEAHMLTTEAFNALLKTLEEPPKHAVFILCTTDPEKLPATIISRCLRFNFHQAETLELIRSLNRVVKNEKLVVEKEVLEVIAQAAEGSFRDGHKILEELAVDGQKITLEKTKILLGQITGLDPQKLLDILNTGDVKKALAEIGRLVEAGADLSVYTQKLLDRLRKLMLINLGVESGDQTNVWELNQITQLINLFTKAINDLKYSPIAQLPLELAVVEYCLGGDKGKEGIIKEDKEIEEIKENKGNGDASLGKVQEKWSEILAGVKPMNHSVEALLKASRPLKIDGQSLILEVFYRFHKDQLETAKCRQIVEEAVNQIIGSPLKLKCVLREKKKEPDILEVANTIFNGYNSANV